MIENLTAVSVQQIVALFYLFCGIMIVWARKHTRYRDLAFMTGISFIGWATTLGLSVSGVIVVPLWWFLIIASLPPTFVMAFAAAVKWGPRKPQRRLEDRQRDS